MSCRRSTGGTICELRFYAAEGPKGREVGDLLRLEEQVVEGLDAVLVLREDRRHDIYRLRQEEEYPLASVMTPMRPLTQGTLGLGTEEGHEACDRAFALACRYSRSRYLVEEMVVANCWPLDRNRPTMTI